MQRVYSSISRSFVLSFPGTSLRRCGATAEHRQVLNYDIWYMIVTYLTLKDTRNLGMVCRECRVATRPRLMSSVEPTDARKLLKMCRYFSDNVYCPATSLQGLHLGRTGFEIEHFAAWRISLRSHLKPSIPRALARLLSQALNLRSLSLHRVEDLIKCNARVGVALAALKHLDTLELFDIGPKTYEVSMRIESRPTSFTLHYGIMGYVSSPEDLAQLMKIPLLERVRKLTLHEFKFGYVAMNADFPGIDSLHPWPAVEELQLFNGYNLPFYQIFPNLRVLSLWGTGRLPHDSMSMIAWPPAVPLRLATMSPHNTSFFLGCLVRFLTLISLVTDSARDAAIRAIRGLSPIALSLWCTNDECIDREFWRGIVSAADAPRARLRYLIVTLCIHPNKGLYWLVRALTHSCQASV